MFVPVIGLEEDNATDLEQIPVIKGLVYFCARDVAARTRSISRKPTQTSCVKWVCDLEAYDIGTHLLMLPSGKDMHGS